MRTTDELLALLAPFFRRERTHRAAEEAAALGHGGGERRLILWLYKTGLPPPEARPPAAGVDDPGDADPTRPAALSHLMPLPGVAGRGGAEDGPHPWQEIAIRAWEDMG